MHYFRLPRNYYFELLFSAIRTRFGNFDHILSDYIKF
jgi:hypothetical protein